MGYRSARTGHGTLRWLKVRVFGAVAGTLLASVAFVPAPTVAAGVPTVLIAGDIATCGGNGDQRTAALIDGRPGIVMTAGDNVYPSGTLREFRRCYDPSWGRFLSRTRPAPGNHEWKTRGAAGYFAYFGRRAGPAGRGYYAFRAGAWRIYVLDSTRCLSSSGAVSGCGRQSKQYQWLAHQLATHPTRCVMAVAHHPRFSSGVSGNHVKVAPLLWLLYRAGAELVINGHDHDYERFAPARPDGKPDAAHGLLQIIAGTGGAWPTGLRAALAPNSQVLSNTSRGVLQLRLAPSGYSWWFLRTDGAIGDQGTGTCHGVAPVAAALAMASARSGADATASGPDGVHLTSRARWES